MAKNKYPHFDPSKHNVDVKMAKVRVSSHCKHNINYHIVFIPKFRKAVLVGEKLKEIQERIKNIKLKLTKLNDGNDGIPPKPKDLGILPTIT